MKIHPIKTDSIAHLSYLIIDGSEAAVIDPRRQADVYYNQAKKNGATIKYIFETHRNEDFVTGSRELKRISGAEIFHGHGLDFAFGNFVDEGQVFKVGDVKLKVLHTPGHTPESISIALYPDSNSEKAVGVFTGDALFVDDVGRTDFFPDEMEKYASMLYDSIHNKILPLGDQTILYPAHGAGSVCGGGIADREVSTLGFEKHHNKMLQHDREKFISIKVNEKHQMPDYFKKMESVNLKGDDCALRIYTSNKFLNVEEFRDTCDSAQVIDSRSTESFIGCHIPGSLSIPSDMIGAYAGYFLDYVRPIYLVSQDLDEAKAVRETLNLLGYDNCFKILRNGMRSWETSGNSLSSIQMIDVNTVKQIEKDSNIILLDVRKPTEWESGTIGNARTIFLGDLKDKVNEFDPEVHVVVYCGSGVRATIGASILLKNGLKKVSVFMGSMAAYKNKN